ncbi:MFS transporter [Streptomyces sp. YC504]|uniref:MFS transporter n=1 Tax=Streptomyces mesophilus TaxID=1775132 RepID=A0A6G4XCB2_9ACTN|nr:MFS transporter [Streptomyces mesophilus]NGO74500.1 MFS transporter [Streptomyces mesophilus]
MTAPVRQSRAAVLLVIVALLVSTVGDEVALVALALRGAEETGLTSVVSAQMLAGLVPGIVLGGVIGRVCDRYRLDVVLGVTLALECATALAAAVFANTPVLLISMMLVLGVLGAVAQTCVMALVPLLFPGSDAQLRVNGLMESVRNAGYIVGPLLVSLLTAHGGTGLALVVDAGTFAFALLAVPVIGGWLAVAARAGGTRPSGVKGTGTEEAGPPPRGGLRLGLSLLWAGTARRMMLTTIMITVAATSVTNVLLPFFTRDVSGGPAFYGTLLATWSVGLVVGPLLLRSGLSRCRTATIAVAAAGLIGLAHAVVGAFPVVPVMLTAFLCGGMANAVQNVALRTHVMADCPPEVRGRVGAAYGATLQTAVAAGFALAAFAPAGWARWGILVGGTIGFLAGLAGWLHTQVSTGDAASVRAVAVPAGTSASGELR